LEESELDEWGKCVLEVVNCLNRRRVKIGDVVVRLSMSVVRSLGWSGDDVGVIVDRRDVGMLRELRDFLSAIN
jgi:hypothetical protein